jgi:hypothetical protein
MALKILINKALRPQVFYRTDGATSNLLTVPHHVCWQCHIKLTDSATSSVLTVPHQVYWQCHVKLTGSAMSSVLAVPCQAYWQRHVKRTGSATSSVLAAPRQVNWQSHIKMPHSLIYLMFNWIFSLLSQFQLMYKIKFWMSVTVRSQSLFLIIMICT